MNIKNTNQLYKVRYIKLTVHEYTYKSIQSLTKITQRSIKQSCFNDLYRSLGANLMEVSDGGAVSKCFYLAYPHLCGFLALIWMISMIPCQIFFHH